MFRKKDSLMRRRAQILEKEVDSGELERLKSIENAILLFKKYIILQYRGLDYRSVTSCFETKETLDKKSIYLEKLESVLTDKALQPSVKWARVQALFQQKSFKENLCAYHRYHFFSFQFLWQCLWQLLSALSFYVSPLQKSYVALEKAFEKPIFHHKNSFFSPAKERTQNFAGSLYSYISTSR